MKFLAALLPVLAFAFSAARGDDRVALAIGDHESLVIFGPKGDRAAELDVPTISKVILVGNETFQVSYGRDQNGLLMVILKPDPASPQDLHFTVLGKNIDADKYAVLVLTFSRALDHLSIDPGYTGLVQVDSHPLKPDGLDDETSPVVLEPSETSPASHGKAELVTRSIPPPTHKRLAAQPARPRPAAPKPASRVVVAPPPLVPSTDLRTSAAKLRPLTTANPPAVPSPAPAVASSAPTVKHEKSKPVPAPRPATPPPVVAETSATVSPAAAPAPAPGPVHTASSSSTLPDVSGSLPLPDSTEVVASSPTPLSTSPGVSDTGSDINLTPVVPVPENPLPPLPKIELNVPKEYTPVLPDLSPQEESPLYQPTIFVKKFVFQGNSVFSDSTLAKQLTKYTGRNITNQELEAARQVVTLYYVSHGYINSGALLPDQDPKDGVILLQVVEGRLTKVVITGNHWFQTWWLRNELRRAAGAPLNFNQLKVGMQTLRETPTIQQVNAELQPGGAPGESTLKVAVKDSMPFRASLEVNNYRPPSVGSTLIQAHVADLNLTGNNDPLTINYGIATLMENTLVLDNLENAAVDYRFPASPWGTTMELGADRDNAGILEYPFNQLDIKSKLTEFHVGIHQPVFDTPYQSLILTLQADERRNETSLFGIPFSLSPGAVNGVEQIFVPRFIQEYIKRTQEDVFSARSQVSWGLNAFNSTVDTGPPDGHFVSWLGQTQYLRRLGKSDDTVILRLNGQIADRPLLSLEQAQLGGISSIRGYLENQALRDNAVLASAELRLPLLVDKDHNGLITLAPFTDFGVGWDNVNAYGPDPADTKFTGRQGVAMPSVGMGLLVNPIKYFDAQIYWGYGLNRKQVPDGSSLQNQGVEFSVSFNGF